MEKSPSGKMGTCSNCGRNKFICNKDGQCNACKNACKDYKKGTPEYAAALAEIKEYFSDPSHRYRRSVKKNTSKEKEKITPVKKSPSIEKKSRKNKTEKMLTIGIKPIAHIANDNIILELTACRDFHLAQADKFSQAITLLS